MTRGSKYMLARALEFDVFPSRKKFGKYFGKNTPGSIFSVQKKLKQRQEQMNSFKKAFLLMTFKMYLKLLLSIFCAVKMVNLISGVHTQVNIDQEEFP